MKSLFDDEFLDEIGAKNDLDKAMEKILEHAMSEIQAGRGCDRAGQTCIVPHMTQNVIDDCMKVQVLKMCDFMRLFGKCAHMLYLERHTPEHAAILKRSMFSIR